MPSCLIKQRDLSHEGNLCVTRRLRLYGRNVRIFRRVKVKVQFTLEQAAKAQRGSRGTALLFL